MHMTSAPHLLSEDRPEFDRLLDEALRTAHDRPELATLGERLNAEQLRTMAMGGPGASDRRGCGRVRPLREGP
ncbi:hypothetical protein GCM10020254_44320 [Streptomyces goshikiensis]